MRSLPVNRRVLHWLWTLLTAAAASGCSMTYKGEDGATHVIGLVDVKFPCKDPKTCNDAIEIESLGISYLNSPPIGSLVIGYDKETLVSIPNDALLVLGDNN